MMRVTTLVAAALLGTAPLAADGPGWCGTGLVDSRSLVALHGYAARSGLVRAATATTDRDQDQVALLEDRGDLVIRRNPFDLDGAAVRLSPNRAGGYDSARMELPADAPGAPVALGPDEAREVELPFAFPFFGTSYREAYLHADGSVTFGRADVTFAERGLARFLSGPPRVAAFFAGLDPSRGGSVAFRSQADRVVFSWTAVPGGGQINRNTFQLALHPDGAIDFVYGEMQSREAI